MGLRLKLDELKNEIAWVKGSNILDKEEPCRRLLLCRIAHAGGDYATRI